ncbi:MmcQ/YjbR family DNA-binding protein [Brevibacterium casei]|uniref:MmcQ/YjbR family DNA-binding protein n=1 Tax=Brevibacterium casei TaxID=33889 RepID=UPI00223BB4B1|nr:MmcQ/YjbR family DNA-binding protein [Brevibacterium casei]MCT1448263.1 MmcQ/YjbR family DNA-binding protein [Brevibacterium casei]
MAHPQMFAADDPVLAWFRTVALSFPEAQEKVSHGRPAFFTKKVFAYFGAAEKHVTGEIEQHPHAVLLLLDPLDAEVMLEREDTFVPMYLGPTGWIGLDLADVAEDELRDLLADSYRSTAPARLARLIDDVAADEAES